MQFLPRGPEPDQVLQALFSGDNFHFGNPFLNWQVLLHDDTFALATNFFAITLLYRLIVHSYAFYSCPLYPRFIFLSPTVDSLTLCPMALLYPTEYLFSFFFFEEITLFQSHHKSFYKNVILILLF